VRDEHRARVVQDAVGWAVRVFLERDLEQADACVRIERAQAHAGRSREGATASGPARQLRSRIAATAAESAAGFGWSVLYRLAEVERGRNTRTAVAAFHQQTLRTRADGASARAPVPTVIGAGYDVAVFVAKRSRIAWLTCSD